MQHVRGERSSPGLRSPFGAWPPKQHLRAATTRPNAPATHHCRMQQPRRTAMIRTMPLANVFDAVRSEGPRGEDLRTRVQVPRRALGLAAGVRVHVPVRLQKDGRAIDRHVADGDGEEISLHLPHEFPSGGVLRLRGQGGRRDDGVPGDLLLEVELVETPRMDRRWLWPLAAVVGLSLSASLVYGCPP